MSRKQLTDDHKAKLAEGRRKRAEQLASRTPVMLAKNLRLYPSDQKNWAFQKLTGVDDNGEELWLSQWYYPTLKQALSVLSQRLVDRSIKGFSSKPVQLQELAELIGQAEQNVLAALGNLAEDFLSEDEEEE